MATRELTGKGYEEKKKPKLGSGKRFATLEHSLAERGATNPQALAAVIGREKYGKKRMARMAAKGRERHEK